MLLNVFEGAFTLTYGQGVAQRQAYVTLHPLILSVSALCQTACPFKLFRIWRVGA